MNAGNISDMIGRIRANKDLLRKNRYRDIQPLNERIHKKARMEFKKAPPEEVEAIKERIRRSARREKIGTVVAFIVGIAATILFFVWLFNVVIPKL